MAHVRSAVRAVSIAVIAAFLLVGCGGGGPRGTGDAEEAQDLDEGGGGETEPGDAIAVEGIRGGIPEHKVEKVMRDNQDAVLECYGDALDGYDFLEGLIDLAIVVDLDGTVYEAYMQGSTLGSLEAESCILDRIRRLRFPKPGGGRAEVSHSLSLAPPYDPPAMLDWSGAEIAGVAEANAADVERCLGGRSGVQLTVYVEVGGKVASAGASGDSIELYEAATCLARAAAAWAFPDPGKGRSAKASISL